MLTFIRHRPLLSYVLLACGLSWLVAIPLMLSRRGILDTEISDAWEILAAFGPFAAALLIAWSLNGRSGAAAIFKSLAHWRVNGFWFLFCVFTPGLLLLAAIILVLMSSGKMPDFESERAMAFSTLAGFVDLFIITGLVQGFGEEPGWRGFALPRLRQRFGPLAATLCLFPAWLLWHLPMFLTRPEFGLAQWIGFSLGILSAAVWLTLIWDATQSLLMVVIWHAFINVHRSMALAVSTPLFLAMGNVVLLGAVVIIGYWLFNPGTPEGQEKVPLST